MRILWITPGFAAGPHDTTCIPPLQLLAQELLRRGVELHVIALEYPFRGEPYWWGNPDLPTFDTGQASSANSGDSGLAGGGALVCPCDGRNRRWLRWRTLMRARRFARQLFAEKPFDVLHSFWLGPAWVLGEQLAAEWQIPHFTTLMGQDVLPSNHYLKRLSAAAAQRLIALTPFHNAQLEKHSGLRAAYCIPWGLAGVDIPQSPPGERAVDVVGVGSLIPVKNWEQWLRVLRIVAEKRPGVRAELIGGGPGEKRLRMLAQQLGLERQLRFAGVLPRAEVMIRLRDSRVLLHTAHFESFGMVLAEAAANGCRVVSTPVGIAPALGDCAEPDTALAGAVLTALEMPVKDMAGAPLRMEACADRYLEMYSSNRLP